MQEARGRRIVCRGKDSGASARLHRSRLNQSCFVRSIRPTALSNDIDQLREPVKQVLMPRQKVEAAAARGCASRRPGHHLKGKTLASLDDVTAAGCVDGDPGRSIETGSPRGTARAGRSADSAPARPMDKAWSISTSPLRGPAGRPERVACST